jgi:integrase
VEVAKFLATVKGRQPEGACHFALFLGMYLHGLTLHDACQLRTSDLDVATGRMKIRRFGPAGQDTGRVSNHPVSSAEADILLAQMRSGAEQAFAGLKGRIPGPGQIVQIYRQYRAAAGLGWRGRHPDELATATRQYLKGRGLADQQVEEFLEGRL